MSEARAERGPGHPRPNDRDGEADRAPPGRARVTGSAAVLCDLCGAPMLDLHCKLVCERCGYKRDCSDP